MSGTRLAQPKRTLGKVAAERQRRRIAACAPPQGKRVEFIGVLGRRNKTQPRRDAEPKLGTMHWPIWSEAKNPVARSHAHTRLDSTRYGSMALGDWKKDFEDLVERRIPALAPLANSSE